MVSSATIDNPILSYLVTVTKHWHDRKDKIKTKSAVIPSHKPIGRLQNSIAACEDICGMF